MGVADMRISADTEDQIVTHALGSCLGVAIYDPVACVGGVVHVMLPMSSADPDKARENPLVFVDSGVAKLFLECYKLGAQKSRLVVKAAGGASISRSEEEDFFQIGKRNFTVLRRLLWKNGVLLQAYDIGGNESRTMSLDIGSGEVLLKSNGRLGRL